MRPAYKATLIALTVLTLIAIASVFRIEYSNDLRDILPEDDPAVRSFQIVSDQFGVAADLYILLTPADERSDPDSLIRTAEAVTAQLTESGLFRSIDAKLPYTARDIMDFARKYALLYLPVSEVKEIVESKNPLMLLDRLSSYRDRWMNSDQFDLSRGYMMSKDQRALLIIAAGQKPPQDIAFARRVTDAINRMTNDLRQQFPAVTIWVSGGYPVAVSSEAIVRQDMISTSVTSLVGVLVLFLIAFRTWQSLPLALIPVTMGMLLTFGVAAWVYGRLTGITIAFAAMLIGLAVDFPIHLYNSFLRGVDRDTQMKSIIPAAQTTAVALLALMLSSIPGLRSLGLLSGAGILICLLVTVVTFPFLLKVFEHDAPSSRLSSGRGRWITVAATPVLIVSLIGTAFLGFHAFRHGALRVPFEEDLTQLRNRHDPTLESQNQIYKKFNSSLTPLMAIVQGPDEEDVMRRCDRIRQALLPLVDDHTLSSCRTVSDFLPLKSRQEEVLRYLATVDKKNVLEVLRPMVAVDHVIDDQQAPFLQTLKQRFMRSTPGSTIGLVVMTTQQKLTQTVERAKVVDDLVARIHAVDPQASLTGLAVLGTRLDRMVRADMGWITLVVAVLVIAVTAFHFRDVGHTVLALVPVLVAVVWTVGAMNLLGIKLNYLNMLVFPMMIGMGIDNGIHIVMRSKGGAAVPEIISELSRPIMMTLLTTMFGFGTFVFAEFTVLNIFGTTMMLALTACLLNSLLVLPAMIHIVRRSRGPA